MAKVRRLAGNDLGAAPRPKAAGANVPPCQVPNSCRFNFACRLSSSTRSSKRP
jgi:hypothetical protein